MADKKEGTLSPMMEQYKRIKAENKDSLLFFRLGDFYEMFFEDAKTASEELDLTLTGKDCGLEERAPMCGVPYHSAEGYIARLVALGHKVAICEQTEDPATAKKLVNRDVIRVITPGTVIEDTMLDETKNNYLCAVNITTSAIGVCFTDASTGESHLTEIPSDNTASNLENELARFSPSEIIISDCKSKPEIGKMLGERFEGAVTVRDEMCFDTFKAGENVCRVFNVISPENIGLTSGSPSLGALGAIIDYLDENGRGNTVPLKSAQYYTQSQFMRFDMTAVRNLEICETMRSKSKKGTLLWVLDRTKTPMGKRLIRSWMLKPLLSVTDIIARQNAVEELFSDTVMRCESVEYLSGVRDIERLITKAVFGTASPKDLLSLRDTSRKFPYIKQTLGLANCKTLKSIFEDIDPLDDIADMIDEAIDDNAPYLLKDGKIIKKGYDMRVDELRDILENNTNCLAQMEIRERERTGIKNLRVRFNKVFGYYIEVTNSFKDMVPDDYIRKQTLTNAERYITEELKEFEAKVLNAKDRSVQLEYEIFDGIRKRVAAAAERFQITAAAIAKLDVLCSLAAVAVDNGYTRPKVDMSGTVNIRSGRHPVVEKLTDTPFVANDVLLDNDDNRCAVITGPNMAGKSTYMRQTALIVLMAQIGSFVPAQSAQIGITDAIFTRVGASDDLASGKSTFMVEMSEVADIIKNATKNSLLILDEIGRGTSTFDGMSIARAVLEYAADKKKLGAKTLFATHYHELTEMENELSGVKNYNIAVKKHGDDIIFLRRIVRGGADDSYGIEVAALSGIPKSVINRAKQILKDIESNGVVQYRTVASADSQIPLEMQSATEIFEDLKNLDVNTLTPIEAMGVLFDLSNKAKSV